MDLFLCLWPIISPYTLMYRFAVKVLKSFIYTGSWWIKKDYVGVIYLCSGCSNIDRKSLVLVEKDRNLCFRSNEVANGEGFKICPLAIRLFHRIEMLFDSVLHFINLWFILDYNLLKLWYGDKLLILGQTPSFWSNFPHGLPLDFILRWFSESLLSW